MNNFEKAIEEIQNFYLIDSSNFESEVFAILKKIINFNSGYIYFSNSEKYEYAYNPQVTKLNEIKGNYIVEDLLFKKTVLGKILITGNSFSDSDKKIFKTCAIIIANIIKDFELSKVIKMQIKALQEGYLEIKKSNKKIKSAEQSKTEFISHASHELRTPINSILGYSELLGEEFTGNLTPKQREFVNDIKISSLHLLGMVNEILDMSKIEAGAMKLNLRAFNLKICIQEVLNIIKPLTINKKQSIKTEIPDIIIKADYQKFQQILFNLLSNAIKYTQENGEIEIFAQNTEKSFTISVKDNGIGIDKKDIKKIFNKFEQIGELQQNSTGLGLAITRELIKIHGGEICVKSKPNKGTIFIVSIPQ